MDWIKQNWLKSVIAFGVIIIGTSAVYYFLYSLPEQNRTRALEVKQEDCTKQGIARYERDKREAEAINKTLLNPRYIYNTERDTCVYFYGSFGRFATVRELIDLKTNQTIYSYIFIPGEELDEDTKNKMVEFNRIEYEIFRAK